MSTAAERVNNAILALDWLAPDDPPGVKSAINDLAAHWVSYWESAERRLSPPVAQAAKVTRYAEWYTRAWALVPEDVRARVPHPRDLDATVWAALEDQLAQVLDGNEAAAREAKRLAEELARQTTRAIKGVVVLGVVAAGVLLAYAYAQTARLRQ